MKARDIARANLVLNKIHTAVVDGLLSEKEIFEDKGFVLLLFRVYKDRLHNRFPGNISLIIFDIRKAVLNRTIALNEVLDNLQPLIFRIRRKHSQKRLN